MRVWTDESNEESGSGTASPSMRTVSLQLASRMACFPTAKGRQISHVSQMTDKGPDDKLFNGQPPQHACLDGVVHSPW
jgi:hypothetical protein